MRSQGQALVDRSPPTTLRHEALFYRDTTDYVRSAAAFVRSGLTAGEPALVAVPGPHLDPLRSALPDRVSFVDMSEVGPHAPPLTGPAAARKP